MKLDKAVPDWVEGLMITLFFLFIIYSGIFDFTDPVETKSFDLRARITAPGEKHPDIELVTITEDDVAEFGRFPWPRDILARGIDHLSMAGAKVIALTIPFTEPEEGPGFVAVRELKQSYEALGLAQPGPGLSFYRKISERLEDLDNDAKLRRAFKEAGNIVLPLCFDTMGSDLDSEVPEFIHRFRYKNIAAAKDQNQLSRVRRLPRLQPILPSLYEVAAGIGHLNFFPDRDGRIRAQTHVLGYLKDIYFPSLAMEIVRVYQGLGEGDIRVDPDTGIYLKPNPAVMLKVPVIDPQTGTLINWNKGPDAAFHRTPFSKIYRNEIQTGLFRDKIVILGSTAPGTGERFATPVSGSLPAPEIAANAVANILDRRFFSRPSWTALLEFAMLVLFGGYISAVLPRLRAATGAALTLGLLVGYGGTGIIMFSHSQIWLRIMPALLLLITGHLLIVSRRFLTAGRVKGRAKTKPSSGRQGARDLIPARDIGAAPAGVEIGSTLGRYKLVGELGRDAMGVVYKGEDPGTCRTVILQTVRFSDYNEGVPGRIKNRFFREAESACLLAHPNIAAVYEVGEKDGLAYVAMEYPEGEGLEFRTTRGEPLSMRDSLSLASKVADALDYAHGRGVVHGEIMPANIMLMKDSGKIKVIGFGIPRMTSSSRIDAGAVPESLAYMSPEQIAAKQVDGRSDIFSLGVVLFELLTGVKPFTGNDTKSLMYGISKRPHPSLRSLNPAIPLVIEKIVDKTLEKKADRRYQKAGRLAEHLRKVVSRMDEIHAAETGQRDTGRVV